MLKTELIHAREKNSQRLMIVLHGLGDSMNGYRWLPEVMNLPWLNYLLVNAPDEYFGGYSWYDFAGDKGVGILRSRELLFKLMDAKREEGSPTGETVLFGFSQGCLMAIEVGLRYPYCFAGIVGISGYVFEPEQLIEELSPVAFQQRLLITHGTQDPLIPLGGVREQINQLKAVGVNIVWHEFIKAHTIAGELELKVIREFIRASFSEK